MKKLILLLIVLSTNLFASYYDDGISLKNEGRYHEAIEAFELELLDSPNNSDAMLFLGLCYSYIGKLPNSITVLKKGTEIAPMYHDIRIALSRVYFWTKQYNEAINQLSFVIEKSPHQIDAHILLGKVLFESNSFKYKEAINSLEKALDISANNPEALIALGDIYMARWEFEKAKEMYGKVDSEIGADRILRADNIEDSLKLYTLTSGYEITDFVNENRESFKDLMISLLYRLDPITSIGISIDRFRHFEMVDYTIKATIDRKINKWLSLNGEINKGVNSNFTPKESIRIGADVKVAQSTILGQAIDVRHYNNSDVIISTTSLTHYMKDGSVDLRLYNSVSDSSHNSSIRISGKYNVNNRFVIGGAYSLGIARDDGSFDNGYSLTAEGEYTVDERNSLKFTMTKDFVSNDLQDNKYNLSLKTKF